MGTPIRIHPAALAYWVEKSVNFLNKALGPGVAIDPESIPDLKEIFKSYYCQIPPELFAELAPGYYELLKVHIVDCVLNGPSFSLCPDRNCCCGGIFIVAASAMPGLRKFMYSKN